MVGSLCPCFGPIALSAMFLLLLWLRCQCLQLGKFLRLPRLTMPQAMSPCSQRCNSKDFQRGGKKSFLPHSGVGQLSQLQSLSSWAFAGVYQESTAFRCFSSLNHSRSHKPDSCFLTFSPGESKPLAFFFTPGLCPLAIILLT